MAVFPITTFCEVTYDSDWYEDDRHLTPYRYSLLRNDTESNSDTVSLTLPSYTYYEYLRSLYDCRTTATGKIPPGYPGSSGGLIENPERARTWHAFGKDTGSELSRAAIRSEPTKIRPTYPFPSLHLIQGGDSGDEYDEEYAVTDRSKQKLVWVDALNKWVPENQLHPRPYMTFIGNAPVIEKAGRPMHKETERKRASSDHSQRPDVHCYMSLVNSKEISLVDSRPDTVDIGGGGGEEKKKVCERFGMHMGKVAHVSQPAHKAPSKTIRNNEKREAIRKRAQELAEQRKQRKAYSTPLYTSMAERRNKKTTLSSKIPHTTPTSPVDQKAPSPIPKPPKEAWQTTDGDSQKIRSPPRPPPSPVKQEISITLAKADDAGDLDMPDTAKMDKKVKFQEQSKTSVTEKPKTPKKKKDPDELGKEELEAKLAQQHLKESLEKQRQRQILEQQRILKEREIQNEKERQEKERLEEEERLRKLKNLEKQPLSKKSNNHENYYENTMNAAGRKLKGKGKGKSQKNKTPKTEKSSSKSTLPVESKEKKVGGSLKRENTFPQTKRSKKENTKAVKLNKAKEKLVDQLTRQFKEVKQTTPRSKPVLAGTRKPPVSIPALTPRQRQPASKKEVPLPITVPSESKLPVEELEQEEPERPKVVSAHRERRKIIVEQRELLKKERRDGRKCVKQEEPVEPEKLPEIETEVKKVESWIYGADDYSEKKSETSEKTEPQIEALPSLTQDLNPELVEKKPETREKRRKSVLARLIAAENNIKKWRKPGLRDTSYLDELRRLELAEERRKKQMEIYERLKNRKHSIFGYAKEDGSPSFEDYGFLAKYCIFTKGNIDMYRYAFDAVDEAKSGWLEGEDVMIALRGINNRLTEAEEEYLYRVLELTGFQITHGADFKMFSVLAALSHRISALDKWMKNFIGKMDFKQLEMKMFKCKTLWECNVDKDTNCISIDQLCVELRAGGVSLEHEVECREKLSHLPALDLLDFLTYVPLFIMIHESVVLNPLDDTRVK